MNKRVLPFIFLASCLAVSAAAQAADSSAPAANPSASREKRIVAKTDAAAPAAPAPLVVYFDLGSTTILSDYKAVLDHALSGLQRRQAHCHDPDWHRGPHRRCGGQS